MNFLIPYLHPWVLGILCVITHIATILLLLNSIYNKKNKNFQNQISLKLMKSLTHRTKIVATIGPASSSPEMLKQMVISSSDEQLKLTKHAKIISYYMSILQ